MANLKDIICTGVIRCLNKIYASEFIGKLTGNADTATSATKATQDESGNNIKASYASSIDISDHTITLKNKNGASLGTVTVPDNNTWRGIQNNLTSDSATDSLSAAQGKVLKGLIDEKAATIPSVGNGTVTIKQAGVSKGTFTMNQSGNTTIELTDTDTTYTDSSGNTYLPGNLTINNGSSDMVQITTEKSDFNTPLYAESISCKGSITVGGNITSANINAIEGEIDSLKKSVSDGKGTVASAITDMGVSTASDATFATMATNVKKIFPTPAQFAAKYKNTFRTLANTPINFDGATAVCYDKRIYVHGSIAGGGDFKSMYCYDIFSNTWTKLASSPVEHHWLNTAVLVGDSILYFGNWSGTSIHLYEYRIPWNDWTDRNVSMPLAVQGASAFIQGRDIRLLSSQYTSYKNNYYYYSIATNTFTRGANLTDADAGDIYGATTTSIPVGDKVYLICGKSAKIKIFDIRTWGTVEDIVSPGKSFGTAVKVGDLIYATSLKYTNTLYVFDINAKTFTKFYTDHYGNHACSACFGDEVFYIGSGSSGHEKKATNIHTELCTEKLN